MWQVEIRFHFELCYFLLVAFISPWLHFYKENAYMNTAYQRGIVMHKWNDWFELFVLCFKVHLRKTDALEGKTAISCMFSGTLTTSSGMLIETWMIGQVRREAVDTVRESGGEVPEILRGKLWSTYPLFNTLLVKPCFTVKHLFKRCDFL